MQICNTLLIHTISTISWVRELKVPSPKAVLTLPHLYRAIQLEITGIQDKSSSNFELSLPPSTLSKKQNETCTQNVIRYFLLPTKHTPKAAEKSGTPVILRNHSNIFQRPYCSWSHIQPQQRKTSLQSRKMCTRHYHRHLMSWTVFLT